MIILHHSCFFGLWAMEQLLLNTYVSQFYHEWNHGMKVLLMTKYHLFTTGELWYTVCLKKKCNSPVLMTENDWQFSLIVEFTGYQQ